MNDSYPKQKIAEAATAMMDDGNLRERIYNAMVRLLVLNSSDLTHFSPVIQENWQFISKSLIDGPGGNIPDRLKAMNDNDVRIIGQRIQALVWAEIYR